MTARTRGGDGAFRKTIAGASRDMRAAELHGEGWSFPRIAAELGFASKGAAYDAVQRAFATIPTPGGALAKRIDLERIDRLIEKNWEVLERRHLMVSQGRVVRRFAGVEKRSDGTEALDADGKPIPVFEDVEDDGPVAASTNVILRLLKRRAEMYAYDEPPTSRVEIVTADDIEANIARLESELAANDPAGTGAA